MIKVFIIILLLLTADAWLIATCVRMEKEYGQEFYADDPADNSGDNTQ